MIIGIFGKEKTLRKNGGDYVKSLGLPSVYLYEHTVSLEEIKTFGESVSLFDEVNIVYGENIFSKLIKEGGDEILMLCKNSKTIFVFDEFEEDKEIKKKMIAVSDHFFDAASAKKERIFPSSLCNTLKKRDKKNAWIEFQKVRKGEAELLHGAILWQMRSLWEDALSGKTTPYSAQELDKKNKELVTIFHEAHRGKVDLMDEMEKFMLTL